MRIIFFLTCISSLMLLTSAKHFKVPQADGSFRLMSQAEVDQVRAVSKEKDDYDPTRDILYYLWTPFNLEEADLLDPNDRSTIVFSNFQRRNPTRLIVHGYLDNKNAEVIQALRREYAATGPFNVIGVDWSAGADTWEYITARDRVTATGNAIGRFLAVMERDMQANLTDFQLIGSDLGGHIVGFASRYLPERMEAIVSLDPSQSLFEYSEPNDRLKFDDAKYVEVIHTDIGNRGFRRAIGSADFFPNGGTVQPGCSTNPESSCSHDRAVKYFVESIRSGVGFRGRECEDDDVTAQGCVTPTEGSKAMGGEPLTVTKGPAAYWLQTNAEPPFARG